MATGFIFTVLSIQVACLRIAHLPHHAQALGVVAGQNVGIHRQRGLELRQGKGRAQADHLYTASQRLKGAPFVRLLADAVKQYGFRCRAVVLGQGLPGPRLRALPRGA